MSDFNEYGPYFKKPLHELILNHPEEYKVDQVIYTLKAYDDDGDASAEKKLSYKIIGPFRERLDF